ncbi:hypothetical protein GCK72_008254 [Caenorhabditis remanei]|uniref:Ribosomal silencing factor RsfS n=1 Tax=Caenorhabditis remanei TaxID=31234 RepID=A0A6A5GWY4_CAERE|nr:hypothetical protein GCK72_008254 [Caenorhabditis remanei]KAF1760008.1 hypothetical protein GCK72_008254 [Caenorhabditis remanei]
MGKFSKIKKVQQEETAKGKMEWEAAGAKDSSDDLSDESIICSVFNSRQAAAISENLRSILKIDGNTVSNGILSHVKKSTKRSNGWYVSEIDRVQIHVMSEDCREKYDLEAIWAGDDRILEEIDELKQKTLLPPQRR